MQEPIDESKISKVQEALIAAASQFIDPLKPEWDARRDIAKTIISLASATLVFTITFSPSLIKASTPLFWRYSVIACWLAFVFSLVLSLASLWFSMGLASLPFVLKGKKFKDAVTEAVRTSNPDLILPAFQEAFGKITREEIVALWLLRSSTTCFGLALLVFTLIGVRQLLN